MTPLQSRLGVLLAVLAWAFPPAAARAGSGETAPQRARAADPASTTIVSAAAFRADGYQPDTTVFRIAGGYLVGSGAGTGCVQAAVPLPPGALLRQVSATLWDDDGVRNLQLELKRVDTVTGSVLGLADLASTGAAPGYVTVTAPALAESVVKAPRAAYYLCTCVTSVDHRLLAVRLDWTPALFADDFELGDPGRWASTVP